MTKKRAVIFIFLVVSIVSGWIYYTFRYSKTHRLQPTSSTEKIRLGNIGEYSILQLIAKENGYFAENGLNAEVVEYSAGPAALKDLLLGKIDVAIAAEFAGVRAMFDHNNLRVLASVDKHEDFRMAVRKDRVTSPADLKGKKIGVTLKGAGEFFLGQFLSFHNIDASEVMVIDTTPEEMTKKLERGELDACVVFNTHIFNIKKVMGDAVDVWPIQRTRKVFATAYSTSGFVERNPDMIRKYLRSMVMAETYLNGHTEESKAVLKKAMRYEDAYIEYIWPNFEFAVRLDQELLLAMEDDARFIIRRKLTKETAVPNYLDYIVFDALDEVKPEAVSIVH